MKSFKLLSFLILILILEPKFANSLEIKRENSSTKQNEREESNFSANQTVRQEGIDEALAFGSTGSEGTDSALKITGFVFKFLTQTVSSIFGQNGLTGAVGNAVFPPKEPLPQRQGCGVQRPLPLPQKQQQAPRSGGTTNAHIPAKAIIYNLISNHEYVAQLFDNIEEEKLLGVVAIVSKSRIIPLIVNSVDLKSLKLNKSLHSFNFDFTEKDHSSSVPDNKFGRQDLEEVASSAPSPAAESALKITSYVFFFLTQTVRSVFGGNPPPSQGQGTATASAYPQTTSGCATQQAAPRSGESQNSRKSNIPEIKLKNDYFNKIFNITSDEQQKILGIVAIISKTGVLPLIVNAVDLGGIEGNPLTNIFRNWDHILNTTTENFAGSSKDDTETEIIKQIQALRKAHPWLLPVI